MRDKRGRFTSFRKSDAFLLMNERLSYETKGHIPERWRVLKEIAARILPWWVRN